MRRFLAGLAIAALLLACDGGAADTTLTTGGTTIPGAAGSTSTSNPLPSTTVAPPTSTAPASPVAPTTTTPATTTAAPTTTTTKVCRPFGGTSDVSVDFPEGLSPLIGKDIRTGAHECSERIVIELQSSDIPIPSRFPGYFVRYATGPVRESPSDAPVTIRGSVVLLVSLGSWMNFMGTAGYSGPSQVFPSNVDHIQELRLLENFEGMTTWGIGLDAKRNFDVSVLEDPSRLVIDIQTSD